MSSLALATTQLIEQESENQSAYYNATGGSKWLDIEYHNDTHWDNKASSITDTGNATINHNWTKISGVVSMNWEVLHTYNSFESAANHSNYSLAPCLNYLGDKVATYFIAKKSSNNNELYCLNETGLVLIGTSAGTSAVRFYEDKVWQVVDNTLPNITNYNISLGYIENETFYEDPDNLHEACCNFQIKGNSYNNYKYNVTMTMIVGEVELEVIRGDTLNQTLSKEYTNQSVCINQFYTTFGGTLECSMTMWHLNTSLFYVKNSTVGYIESSGSGGGGGGSIEVPSIDGITTVGGGYEVVGEMLESYNPEKYQELQLAFTDLLRGQDIKHLINALVTFTKTLIEYIFKQPGNLGGQIQ